MGLRKFVDLGTLYSSLAARKTKEDKMLQRLVFETIYVLSILPFVTLILPLMFASLSVFIVSIITILFIFTSIIFLIYLIKDSKELSKVKLTPKEVLFYYLYNVYKNLIEFSKDVTKIKSLELTIKYLDKTRRNIIYSKSDNFGFEFNKKIIDFLDVLNKRITKSKNDLDVLNPSNDVVSTYIILFEKILINLQDDNIDNLLKFVKKDFKEEKGRFELFTSKIVSSIQLKDIIKYFISFVIVFLMSIIFVTILEMPISNDLSSMLVLIITIATLTAGIKLIIDKLDYIFSKES